LWRYNEEDWSVPYTLLGIWLPDNIYESDFMCCYSTGCQVCYQAKWLSTKTTRSRISIWKESKDKCSGICYPYCFNTDLHCVDYFSWQCIQKNQQETKRAEYGAQLLWGFVRYHSFVHDVFYLRREKRDDDEFG
jgi:hypothetical protein